VVRLPLVAAGDEQERHEHHAQTHHQGTVHSVNLLSWSNKVSLQTVHPQLQASFSWGGFASTSSVSTFPFIHLR
jgi:hypothetical protein